MLPNPHQVALMPKPNHVAVLPKPNHVAVLPKPNQVAVLPKPNQVAVLPKPNQVAVLPKPLKPQRPTSPVCSDPRRGFLMAARVLMVRDGAGASSGSQPLVHTRISTGLTGADTGPSARHPAA